MLAGLASTYVDAINNGAVPVIATAWQVRKGGQNDALQGPFGTEDGRLFNEGGQRSPFAVTERTYGSWSAPLGVPVRIVLSVKLMEVKREREF